ncbi:MAG: YicC family protein [Clostridia bacterium]|nr:YicC family protein [Clostridia bacterium]
MLRSMTGYGRAEASYDDIKAAVEVKSVNHRYLEVTVRLPGRFSILEDKIKKTVQHFVDRGHIEVWFGIDEKQDQACQMRIDKDLAIYYYRVLKEIADKLGISYQLPVYELCKMEGVVIPEESDTDLEKVWGAISRPLKEALQQLVSMREREGQNLREDLEAHQAKITSKILEIEKRNPDIVESYRDKLTKRIEKLTDGTVEVDQERLAAEVAIFADKSDVNEELVRLKSHLKQFSETMESHNPVGRKLDFILQEIIREINTVSSKSQDAFTSRKVVEVKSEIEKMREQVQNIE